MSSLITKFAFALLATGCVLFASIVLVAQPRVDVPEKYQRSYDAEALGDYAGALSALEGMPLSEQSSYVFHLRQGWLRYLSGDYEASISAYERAIRANPAAVEARLGLQLPQMALRRWLDVEVATWELLEIDPMNYLARRRLALALYNLGRYAEAEAIYRAVLESYPSDVEVEAGLGWSLLMQGNATGAAEVFTHVLWVAPNQASGLEGLQALITEP